MDPTTFTFGDNRALYDELLALVRAGRKTATWRALRDYAEGGEAWPEGGGAAGTATRPS